MNAPNTSDRLLRLSEVKNLTGLSKATVYRRAVLPTNHPEHFPGWIKLGRATAWSAREVAEWIERQKARRAAA